MAYPHTFIAGLLATAAALSGCGGGGSSTAGAVAAATAAAPGFSGAAAASASETTAASTNAPIQTTTNSSTPDLSATVGDSADVSQALAVRSPAALGTAGTKTSANPPTLTLRARADLAANVGALVALRIDGATIATVEVRSTTLADYTVSAPTLKAGAKVDVAYTNDAVVSGQDRNLYIGYLISGDTVVLPTLPGAVFDRGNGAAAFDGVDTMDGRGDLYWSGALRLTWPGTAVADPLLPSRIAASRFLLQASFGPTTAEITRLASITPASWIDQQMALPATPDFVNHVQAKYALGDAYRPGGSKYDPGFVAQKFWANVAQSPDQLRKRVGFALHQIFMVSQQDSNLYDQARAYASYLDTLNKNAFGNYRTLLEDMALSPAMGIYLSHLRNRKEDAATGRLPDENFAREVMQLFSIGLVELNTDGSPKLNAQGKPIETYTNADVMALAKVFTGWGWAYPDAQLTEQTFRWSSPDLSTAAKDTGIDLLKMKAYPGMASSAEKKLFTGKANAVLIPAGASAAEGLRLALDALYRHANVGPFIGRQLIQRLVTSNPNPAYVARVAAVFNNNGAGVRGDLAAVVRAVLLDTDARNNAPPVGFGKLREPVLRVAQWLRAFGATSSTGDFMLAWELDNQSQRAFNAPSVFSYFRPGYVPPNTSFAATSATTPEFQIVNESTAAAWVNTAEQMVMGGLGWTGSASDVSSSYAPQVVLASAGNLGGLLDNINLLLLAGRMSAELRQALLDAVIGVGGSDAASQLNRARAAAFMAMASNEFLVQK